MRGELLLRQMELLNGMEPERIEVSGSAIASMSDKGITLTLPQDGIQKLFLPAEFFTTDRLNGKVELRLYPNWNYSFKTERGFESITGAKLAQYLSGEELQPIDVVQRRMAAMERKATRVRVHQLNDILWTLKNEGIESSDDFCTTLEGLRGKAAAIQSRIAAAENKQAQYQQVAKWLNTVQSYRELNNTRNSISPWRKRKFELEHQVELEAYGHTSERLRSYGISEDLELEKVEAMIGQQKEQIRDFTQAKRKVDERIRKLRVAQEEIQNGQKTQQLSLEI